MKKSTVDVTAILGEILENTYTYSDVTRRLRLLKEYLANKLFTFNSLPAQFYQSDTAWLASLRQNFYQSFNKDNLYKLLAEIEERIKKVRILIIYLPFDLPDHEMIRLGKYIRNTYGKSFLMEIKYDPELIAGCALVWNGIYKDYSIKYQIEQKRQEILTSLKQTFKPVGNN